MKTPKPTKKQTIAALLNAARENHESINTKIQAKSDKLKKEIEEQLRDCVLLPEIINVEAEWGSAHRLVVTFDPSCKLALRKLVQKLRDVPNLRPFNEFRTRKKITEDLDTLSGEVLRILELPSVKEEIRKLI